MNDNRQYPTMTEYFYNRLNYGRARLWAFRRWDSVILTLLILWAIRTIWTWGMDNQRRTTIIVVTPTHKRPERLADMTRFSQTLAHIKNLHWIVIEDGTSKVEAVERILIRSGLPYTYFTATTEQGFPKRGWTHRNVALRYIRKNYRDYRRGAVIYFADDDNSYDIRLFNDYIRNVKKIGIWAVGLVGSALVEAPHVSNGTITSWDVVYAPKRAFATDMAGFAINIDLVLQFPNAEFNRACTKKVPESCFLEQFNITKEGCEAFGYDDDPKDILVWHTKTKNGGTRGERHGYVVE
uniref:Galactosylgalactosylxylosylprotein 3-beta-glucuronosyltransferase n=1 Tax=Steinernema glaseri TaxID=37863 RepID=A0A1I7ZFJ9_9BILA